MKKNHLSLAVVVLATLLPFVPAQAQWVFVARKALGRIEHMREGQQGGGQQGGGQAYDFATVLLEAPADRVFAVALEMARKNRTVQVVMQDPAQRRFQVAQGDRTATFNVVPFGDDVSQLLIAGHAGPGEDATTPRVVEAVLRVCREMGKQCQVGG